MDLTHGNPHKTAHVFFLLHKTPHLLLELSPSPPFSRAVVLRFRPKTGADLKNAPQKRGIKWAPRPPSGAAGTSTAGCAASPGRPSSDPARGPGNCRGQGCRLVSFGWTWRTWESAKGNPWEKLGKNLKVWRNHRKTIGKIIEKSVRNLLL